MLVLSTPSACSAAMIPLKCIPESCSRPSGAPQSTDSVNSRTTRSRTHTAHRTSDASAFSRVSFVLTYVAERLPPLRVTRNSGAACRHVTRHLWHGWGESDHVSLAREATYAVSQWFLVLMAADPLTRAPIPWLRFAALRFAVTCAGYLGASHRRSIIARLPYSYSRFASHFSSPVPMVLSAHLL